MQANVSDVVNPCGLEEKTPLNGILDYGSSFTLLLGGHKMFRILIQASKSREIAVHAFIFFTNRL